MAEAHDLVWYAAYGSNLLYERFMAYIEGGVPEGSTRRHRGCSDSTPPRAARPCRIPHRLYFAREARSWGGGGVAFVRPDPEPEAAALGRRYLVTHAQLVQILEQENGVEQGAFSADVTEELVRTGEPGQRVTLPGGWYDLLLCVGHAPAGDPEEPDVPIWTFTSSRDLSEGAHGPSKEYLHTLAVGLLETYWSAQIPSDDEERERPEGAPLFVLEEYLDRVLPESFPHPQDWVRRHLQDWKNEFVERALRRSGRFTVWKTDGPIDRARHGRGFFVRLHEQDQKELGIWRGRFVEFLRRHFPRLLPTTVIIESHHPPAPRRVRGFVLPRLRHEPADPLREGVVELDQKLRQALGVGFEHRDRVTVRKPEWHELGPTGRHHRLATWLQRTGSYQQQLMRVTAARYEDMEIPICRLPSTSFGILGIEPGDSVIVESLTAGKSLRALEATHAMVEERYKDLSKGWRLHDCTELLSLERTSLDHHDLPLLFLDEDAREELNLSQCDPVHVYRDVPWLLSKELRGVALTLLLGASIVIFRLEELPSPTHWAAFVAVAVVAFFLLLYRVRKQIG